MVRNESCLIIFCISFSFVILLVLSETPQKKRKTKSKLSVGDSSSDGISEEMDDIKDRLEKEISELRRILEIG
jgi:hypothetical protein